MAQAADQLICRIEIPELDVAEYHRPYIAVWIESPDRKIIRNLAVWYDDDMPKDEGETWLKDMRQWWRRIGRRTEMPVDGVSGATKRVGTHEIKLPFHSNIIKDISEGDFTLYVEASREVGGREILSIPFKWKVKTKQNSQGQSELGLVQLEIK